MAPKGNNIFLTRSESVFEEWEKSSDKEGISGWNESSPRKRHSTP